MENRLDLTIKKTALSKEEMEVLREKGVDISDASMCWRNGISGRLDALFVVEYDVTREYWRKEDKWGVYPAYNLQDILDKFPLLYPTYESDKLVVDKRTDSGAVYYPDIYKDNDIYYAGYISNEGDSAMSFEDENSLDAAHKLLIHCLDEGLIL